MAYKIDLDRFARRCDRLGGDLREAAVRGLRSAGQAMKPLIHEMINTPNRAEDVQYACDDTGELAGSISVTNTDDGCIVSVDAPHAPYLEYGTRPHPVSNQGFLALMEWAMRKGLADDEEEAERVAWLIRENINAYGSQPRHYMARSVRRMKTRGILHREMALELAKIKGA